MEVLSVNCRFQRKLKSAFYRALLSVASFAMLSRASEAQMGAKSIGVRTPEVQSAPAIPAILKAFDTYEVVAMPAAHGEKDIDDFILTLIRDPRFPNTVNDIVVECGNMRLQPVLDRYIAGEDVAFTEVQHVWRDTTVQQMCGASGFYEQLYPLVRAINRKLPASQRLRIVAADPPIDWSAIHSYQDLTPFFARDGNIASVMEREVLAKHRKALMLFGIFHLLHGGGPGDGDAVTQYERHYPGKTFVVFNIGEKGAGESSEGLGQPNGVRPLLLRSRGSSLGAARFDSILQSPITTDEACNVNDAFASTSGKTVADFIDAFLYLGPQASMLMELLPADIALDRPYRSEWLRRMKMVGMPGPASLEELDAQIVAGAADPLLPAPPKGSLPQAFRERVRQSCLSQKHAGASTAK